MTSLIDLGAIKFASFENAISRRTRVPKRIIGRKHEDSSDDDSWNRWEEGGGETRESSRTI